jgi:hypothetical protein
MLFENKINSGETAVKLNIKPSLVAEKATLLVAVKNIEKER